jgi:hypothetical protein
VFCLCIASLIGLFYGIQWINLNCTLYSRKDIELLARYNCQLKFMKLKYEQLTNDLNMLALATEEQVDRLAQTIKTPNQSFHTNLFGN